jgi:hypothetical protein
MYHVQFSLQAASPETFGYTLSCWSQSYFSLKYVNYSSHQKPFQIKLTDISEEYILFYVIISCAMRLFEQNRYSFVLTSCRIGVILELFEILV